MAEAMRHALVDRNNFLGDPDFVDNPLEHLLSRRARGSRSAPPSPTAPHRLPQLTPAPHRTSVRKRRVTPLWTKPATRSRSPIPLTADFGAGVMADGTGFLLNNEMDDFTVKSGAPNAFRPRPGRDERDRAWQTTAVLHGADHRAAGRQRCRWCLARPAVPASSRSCWRPS